MDYNVQFAEVEVTVVHGDAVDITYSVADDGDDFDMSSKQLDMVVTSDRGTAFASWSSAGDDPAITISTSSVNIADATGFTSPGLYNGWLRNTTDDYSMARFTFIVI